MPLPKHGSRVRYIGPSVMPLVKHGETYVVFGDAEATAKTPIVRRDGSHYFEPPRVSICVIDNEDTFGGVLSFPPEYFEEVPSPNRESDHDALTLMREEGGGFVRALAEAFFQADAGNYAKLRSAFGDLVDEYAGYVKFRKEDQ